MSAADHTAPIEPPKSWESSDTNGYTREQWIRATQLYGHYMTRHAHAFAPCSQCRGCGRCDHCPNTADAPCHNGVTLCPGC